MYCVVIDLLFASFLLSCNCQSCIDVIICNKYEIELKVFSYVKVLE